MSHAPRLRILTLMALGCAPVEPAPVGNNGGGPGDPDPGDTGEAPLLPVYDLDHLVRVEIDLPAADWDALRTETRTFADTLMKEDCQAEPFESPFNWYEASVTIDGQHIPRADVRKKGFLGSLHETKPSLKLDLGEFDPEASFHGERRLTLNNAIADPALVRQCLTYQFFLDAGLPASRCNLAQVSVNGDDLGIFVNVEPLKEPMLARHFEQSDGNLYEGTLADFREGWTGTMERKNNESDTDHSDIMAVAEAAAQPDAALIEALDAVVDLDQFYLFWAAEGLIEHADGYSGNTNNFYVYADPSDGRFRFIPWGVDAVLYGYYWDEEQGELAPTESVYASSILTQRLYALPEGRERYEDAMRSLLEGPWDEAVLEDRIDRMAALIQPELNQKQWREVNENLGWLRSHIGDRAPTITAELDDGLGDWPWPLRESYCFVPYGEVDATFAGEWGTLDAPDFWGTGESELHIDVGDGNVWTGVEGGALMGAAEGQAVMYLNAWISDTEAMLIYLSMERADVAPGTVAIDLTQNFGGLFYIDTRTMNDFALVSYVVGELTLTQGADSNDAPVVGTLDAALMDF